MLNPTTLAFTLWCSAIIGALTWFGWYDNQAGAVQAPPSALPSNNTPSKEPPYKLLIFLHPFCPCSQASVSELEKIQRQSKRPVAITAYMMTLPEHPITRSPLWKRVAAIDGITLLKDDGGQIAKQFRVKTSGQVMLYDPKGKLLFFGGVTPSRGHEGENDGSRAILNTLNRGLDNMTPTTPIFGCGMFNKAS